MVAADLALGEGDRIARRNALILAGAQALAGGNASVIFATSAIVGAGLAPEAALATVPASVFVVGMAAGTLPAGMIARAHGRRVAFIIGAGFGAASGALASVAVLRASFGLYLLATFLGGIYAAVAQSYRFAAADTASAGFRPKAISWVMAGGVLAGFVGPQLVQWTMNAWAPYLFAASYAAQVIVALLAMALLSRVRIPKPPPARFDAGRPLREIVMTPRFATAAFCGVVSYALMNLVMTAAPLAMRMCGHTVTDSNLAIQWHVVAMYAPSFFTGSLIARFGSARVIATGLALTAIGGAVAFHGVSVAHFWTELVLIGIGWNFGFVGATAMVTETHRPDERNKVQAFNDFLVFGTMAAGSFSSGHILAASGWEAVNLVVFPPVALALLVLAWIGFAKGRPRPA